MTEYFIIAAFNLFVFLQPLAVVTWGCVYSMEWVQPTEIKDWLMDKQLKLDDDSGGASYSHGKTVRWWTCM